MRNEVPFISGLVFRIRGQVRQGYYT